MEKEKNELEPPLELKLSNNNPLLFYCKPNLYKYYLK